MTEVRSIDDVVTLTRGIYGRWSRETSIGEMRQDWDEFFKLRAKPWPIEKADANGVAAEWIGLSDIRPERTILYLHGGGFRLGSITSHRDLIQRLAIAAQARVLAIDYRLSPEASFPAPIEDALAAYRWLLDQGLAASNIAFAGDSAGGGLALSCMLAARKAEIELPAATFLMSPWVDLTAGSASYVTRADRDPIHRRSMILGMARAYLGKDGDARNPLASPLFADLRGLPPLLVQCGGREIILDDSVLLAERARTSGVETALDVREDMIHVFQMFEELPEATEALDHAGTFLKTHVRAAPLPRRAMR
jgi:epsilon-lactone hydrolase